MPRSVTTGHFILHSNVLPKVTAGRYELVSEQTGTPFTVAPEPTTVTVAAPLCDAYRPGPFHVPASQCRGLVQ